jgi:hypothetical protein
VQAGSCHYEDTKRYSGNNKIGQKIRRGKDQIVDHTIRLSGENRAGREITIDPTIDGRMS